MLAIKDIYIHLNEKFAPFVAETIPFLAEVMEDDQPTVTQTVSDLVLTIEKHAEISLSEYFR
jgi:hypothetical protein